MKFEDRVLGVIVLSKLGLHQFSADDLRLLEIYGSLAAQAVRTAAATEGLHAQSAALERRVRSQQELLSLTEAIITTRDQSTLLELVVDRLSRLVETDTITVNVHEPVGHLLRPLVARGIHADLYGTGPGRRSGHLRLGPPPWRGSAGPRRADRPTGSQPGDRTGGGVAHHRPPARA